MRRGLNRPRVVAWEDVVSITLGNASAAGMGPGGLMLTVIYRWAKPAGPKKNHWICISCVFCRGLGEIDAAMHTAWAWHDRADSSLHGEDQG